MTHLLVDLKNWRCCPFLGRGVRIARGRGIGLLLILGAMGVWEQQSVAQTVEPFAACRSEFWAQQLPAVPEAGRLYALCSEHFATLYSSMTKTPVYSAEHLTEQQIAAAIGMERIGMFHEDRRVAEADAAQLESYRHSGWDRGHMAPSGDEPDADSQEESFVLSNMVPQDPDDNRHLWADIETAVRELVLAGGDDVYVVTGPIFDPDQSQSLPGGVEVPSLLFKAIYDPRAGVAGVYVARNAPGQRYWPMSLSDFHARFGIAPFPGVPAAVADARPDLPRPMMLRHSGD